MDGKYVYTVSKIRQAITGVVMDMHGMSENDQKMFDGLLATNGNSRNKDTTALSVAHRWLYFA